MRVCFCVSSLFLLLVLIEEQRFVLLCPRGRKKERRRKKTSSSAFKFSRIFKNFYLLTTRKSAQQNTHCFHAPRSIQVRVQNVRTRALSFGLLLKVPSSNASKLSHKSEKSECIEKFISLPERGLLVVERKAVLRHKKSEKKKPPWCNSSVILISQPCASRRFRGGRARGKCNSFARYYYNHLQIDRYRCCFLNRSSLCVCFCGRRFIFSLLLQLFSRHN